MDKTTEMINQILAREDIEDLISMGAPEDEYMTEAVQILKMVNLLDHNEKNQENISSIVAVIWNEYFGPLSESEISIRMPQFRRVARILV